MSFLAAAGAVAAATAPYLYQEYQTTRAHHYQNRSIANAQDFTREQMQNRHQWEVDDLRRAGLNPALSATGGGSPIGGSPTASSPGFGNPGNPGETYANMQSAFASQRLIRAQIAEVDARKQQVEAQTKQIEAETKRTGQDVDKFGNIPALLRYLVENVNIGGLGQGALGLLGAYLFGRGARAGSALPGLTAAQFKDLQNRGFKISKVGAGAAPAAAVGTPAAAAAARSGLPWLRLLGRAGVAGLLGAGAYGYYRYIKSIPDWHKIRTPFEWRHQADDAMRRGSHKTTDYGKNRGVY